MGEGLERRHQTQTGDSDVGRPRVSADGYLSGDSTPLLITRERLTGMVFAAAVTMKGGGDPHTACLLAKWIDGLGCQQVTIGTDGELSIGVCSSGCSSSSGGEKKRPQDAEAEVPVQCRARDPRQGLTIRCCRRLGAAVTERVV